MLQKAAASLAICAFWLGATLPAAASQTAQRLCGWIENPTPANWWLTDARGQWIINTQGGRQADGDTPTFKDNQWVKTQPDGYGYGCGCIDAVVEVKDKAVVKIKMARALPLATCRRDKALKEPGE